MRPPRPVVPSPSAAGRALALGALLAACGGGGGGRAAPADPRARAAADGGGCAARDTSGVTEERADVVILATVTAREVRVREPARASVALAGDSTARGVSCDDRVNLPRPARPGTYRDVRIDYRLRVGRDTAGTPADTARPPAAPR